MFRNFLLSALVVLVSAVPMEAAAQTEKAGRVEFVTGEIWFVDATQQKRRPLKGEYLHASDTVVTGADGEAHFDMEDGGYLAVRSNTQFRVDDFRARGDKEDRIFLSLIKGALRSFTGWIPKGQPRNYQIRTITAAVGVRGTDHETIFIPEGSGLGEPGTYDKVNEGTTFISHASGQVHIHQNQAGFAPLDPSAAARLLEAVPAFFVPSINENLLAGRHKMVQERLQQRLNERRRLNQSQPQSGQAPQEQQPVSEMQETPREPDAGNVGDVGSATGSSLLPSALPAATLPGTAPSVPTPSVSSLPATSPAVSSAAAPAVVPASAPASATTVRPAVTPGDSATSSAVAPASRDSSRAVEAGRPATNTPAARAGRVTENERERLYNERRKKQQENRREAYERERDNELERESAGTTGESTRQ